MPHIFTNQTKTGSDLLAMLTKVVIFLICGLMQGRYVTSIILDGRGQTQPAVFTTQDPLLHSGLNGFLQMIQEFGSLKSQVEQQELTNRLLEEKVTRLEILLEEVNRTAVTETNYLAQGERVGGEIASLMQTTTMIESQMTNVVTMSTLLSMDMMKVQRSLDDVKDCHATFTTRLENMTSLLTTVNQTAEQLQSETLLMNQTNNEIQGDLLNLNDKTDHMQTVIKRVDELKCESGKLFFDGSFYSTPMKHAATFSKPFARIPTISYGVVGIQSQTRSYDLKFQVTLSDVTSSGFSLQVEKTGIQGLSKLDVQWMACLV